MLRAPLDHFGASYTFAIEILSSLIQVSWAPMQDTETMNVVSVLYFQTRRFVRCDRASCNTLQFIYYTT